MTRTFDKIPPDRFAALTSLLRGRGIAVPEGNTGTIRIPSPEIAVDFNYDGIGSLTLAITRKPAFVPEAMVWSQIEKALTSAA